MLGGLNAVMEQYIQLLNVYVSARLKGSMPMFTWMHTGARPTPYFISMISNPYSIQTHKTCRWIDIITINLIEFKLIGEAYRPSSNISIVGFFIPVSSLKVFAHSIHSERRRIYLGKSIQSLQNDTIIISWVFSFRVIQPTMRWHTFKTFMFVFITSCSS